MNNDFKFNICCFYIMCSVCTLHICLWSWRYNTICPCKFHFVCGFCFEVFKCSVLFLHLILIYAEAFLLKNIRVSEWYRGSVSFLPVKCPSRLLPTHNALVIRKANCVQVKCIFSIDCYLDRVFIRLNMGRKEIKTVTIFSICMSIDKKRVSFHWKQTRLIPQHNQFKPNLHSICPQP